MIEVRLTPAKLAQLDHEVHIANWVLAQLKEAGAPVIGTLLPRIVTGTLTISCDEFDTGDYIYRWRE
jgi:hypothetical protein